VARGKKTVKDHVDAAVEQLPDKAELLDLKDKLVEHLPDKEELLALRDDLVDRLPDEVGEKLPIETKKAKRFATVKKVALVGMLTAGVAAAVAYIKAKMADQPTYTASTYTTPGAPTGQNPPPPA